MTINVNKPEDYIRPYELTETQSKSTSCHYQMFFQKKKNFPPGGPRSSGRSSNTGKKRQAQKTPVKSGIIKLVQKC